MSDPNTTKTKPPEKVEVNKNCAKHDAVKVPEVPRKDTVSKKSSVASSKKDVVTGSWASSYLQSIGHSAGPIKLNLSLSRNKTTKSTESTSNKDKKEEIKTLNVKKADIKLPPTSQSTSIGFRTRMDTKTWLTQTLKNTTENEIKAAATIEPNSNLKSEPNIISTNFVSDPTTDSSASRFDTPQLNKQPDTKTIDRPNEVMNANNTVHNINPITQNNLDTQNHLVSHTTPYANFTPRTETVNWRAHTNTIGADIQGHYNNCMGGYSAFQTSYSPHMDTTIWPGATYTIPIHNSLNNNLPNHLISDYNTPYGNFTYHTDTVTCQNHFYGNIIHTHYQGLGTMNLSIPLESEDNQIYPNSTSSTTPYTSYAPHIDKVSHSNQAPHGSSYCSREDINSNYLTKYSLSEHDRTCSNQSHTTSDSSIRPRNDIVTWLTQLMHGENATYNSKSHISYNDLTQRELGCKHAELSVDKKKFLVHSNEKNKESTYDTKKKDSKPRDLSMSSSNKNKVSHFVKSKTCTDKEIRSEGSFKSDINKTGKNTTKDKPSGSVTKKPSISSAKSKLRGTEAVCVKKSKTSPQTTTKEKLEKETARLEARLKSVNLKIMKLMSQTDAPNPGSTSILNFGKDGINSKDTREHDKADKKSEVGPKMNLPEKKDSLKTKTQYNKKDTLKRKSRSPEHTNKKRRLCSKIEERKSKIVARSSSCDSSENQNSLRNVERGRYSSRDKSAEIQSKDNKGIKRRNPISSEIENKSTETPPRKRIRRDSSQTLVITQNIPTSEVNSDQENKNDLKMKGPIKSIVKLPENSHSKHPRIIGPESNSTDDENEGDFDLRSRLSKRNYELLSKRINYDHQSKEKTETPRENLVITINRNGNEEEHNKLPMPEQSKPKHKKYKKIQLIIKVLCEDQEGSSESSSDEEKPSGNVGAQNVDSFLDDFNVDEIVNSLKHSPKCDTNEQDNHNVSKQVISAKDKEIKKMTTKSFVQPIKIKKEIKSEILDDGDIQSISIDNSEIFKDSVNMNTPEDIKMTEPSTCRVHTMITTNDNLETSIKPKEEIAQLDPVYIKKEKDTDVVEDNVVISVTSFNDVNRIVKLPAKTKSDEPTLDCNIKTGSKPFPYVNNKANINSEASMENCKDIAVVDLTKVKKENNELEDIICVSPLNEKVGKIDKHTIEPQLGNTIQAALQPHDRQGYKETKHDLEVLIEDNEKVKCVEDLINIKKEKDTIDLEDYEMKCVPSFIENEDQVVNLCDSMLDSDIEIVTESHLDLEDIESDNSLVFELVKTDNHTKVNQQNELETLYDANNLIKEDNPQTHTEAQYLQYYNTCEVPVPEILEETNYIGEITKEENNDKTETTEDHKTEDLNASTISPISFEKEDRQLESQIENRKNNSKTTITESIENSIENKDSELKSNNSDIRTVSIVPSSGTNSTTDNERSMCQANRILGNEIEKCILDCLHKDISVTSLIHQGRFSKMFKIMDTRGEFYAVKMITKASKNKTVISWGKQTTTMFKNIQNGVPKRNLNTVYFYNGFPLGKNWCFLLEYYPKNLRDALKTEMFHIDQVQNMARQLVAAVAMLRHNNIIHSDINPRHILIDASSDRVKLAGFDAAYYRGTRRVLPNIGTVSYRAPEIILGYSADFSIDVWSTAAVIYQMATGVKLFNGTYNNEVLYLQMCTFGSLPCDMIQHAVFAYQHFSGMTFRRRTGEHGRIITYIREMYLTRSIDSFVRHSYMTEWRESRTYSQRLRDLSKLDSMLELLKEMLVLDPRQRASIEYAYAHPFVYEC